MYNRGNEKMEKLDFFDAMRIVAGTERAIRFCGGSNRYKDKTLWSTLQADGTQDGKGNHSRAFLQSRGGACWWPTLEEQKKKAWEVEPVEIIVWGACEDDGASFLHGGFPYRHEGGWICNDIEGGLTPILNQKNLFPKDKPQKYKLVPVDDE